jgi:hypothetical protein
VAGEALLIPELDVCGRILGEKSAVMRINKLYWYVLVLNSPKKTHLLLRFIVAI